MTHFAHTNDPVVAQLVDEYEYLYKRLTETAEDIVAAQHAYVDRLEEAENRKALLLKAELEKKLTAYARAKQQAREMRQQEKTERLRQKREDNYRAWKELQEEKKREKRAALLRRQQEYHDNLKNAIYLPDGTIAGARTAKKFGWHPQHYLDWLAKEHPSRKREVGKPSVPQKHVHTRAHG